MRATSKKETPEEARARRLADFPYLNPDQTQLWIVIDEAGAKLLTVGVVPGYLQVQIAEMLKLSPPFAEEGQGTAGGAPGSTAEGSGGSTGSGPAASSIDV